MVSTRRSQGKADPKVTLAARNDVTTKRQKPSKRDGALGSKQTKSKGEVTTTSTTKGRDKQVAEGVLSRGGRGVGQRQGIEEAARGIGQQMIRYVLSRAIASGTNTPSSHQEMIHCVLLERSVLV